MLIKKRKEEVKESREVTQNGEKIKIKNSIYKYNKIPYTIYILFLIIKFYRRYSIKL